MAVSPAEWVRRAAADVRSYASTESYARDCGRAKHLEDAADMVTTSAEALIALTAAGIRRGDYIWRTLGIPF